MTNAITNITQGSIEDVRRRQGLSLPEALMNAKLLVICDRSGSMDDYIEGVRGLRKIDKLREHLARLQRKYEGSVLVMQFDDYAEYKLGGVVDEPRGGTRMIPALELAREADKIVEKIAFLSDGSPGDAERDILNAARQLDHALDCIYIGEEGERGAIFMKQLASVKNGTYSNESNAMLQLESKLSGLLGSGS